MKKLLFIVFLGFIAQTSAMEKHDAIFHNTYNGTLITADNILKYAPVMPDELAKNSVSWIEKHKDNAREYAQTPYSVSLDAIKDKAGTIKKSIQEKYTNLSKG